MFDSDKYQYTEYAKDKHKYEELYVKVKKALAKGIIYKKDVEALEKVRNKLIYHAYPTYQTLEPIGAQYA